MAAAALLAPCAVAVRLLLLVAAAASGGAEGLPGCRVALREGAPTTGEQLLGGCAAAAERGLEAAIRGAGAEALALEAAFVGCVEAAEPLVWQAFENGPACAGCAEACALVLVLQGLAMAYSETPLCSQTLLFFVNAYRILASVEPVAMLSVAEMLPEMVNARRAQCGEARRRELEAVSLPPADADAPWYDAGPRVGAPASGQVAVLLAATPSMVRTYQPFINLWRCYALRHGLPFLLETDDTEVSPPHHRAANWMRWFAARRHLAFYRALLVVDPDEFVVPECWNMSIPAILGAWADGGAAPAVAMRDFGRPQTLNNGVVLVRNSPRGLFFLDLLLEKAAWMQTIEKDQGAFDETVLEVLGLEARAPVAAAAERGASLGGSGAGYGSECAQHVFPNAKGNHEVALYALCWWRESEHLAGPFAARRSSVIRFADPQLADINHVVGARGVDEPAILHHFAGRSKDWDEMLSIFGMSRRATAHCGRVFEHVDGAASERSCVPGAPPVRECEPPVLVC